MFLLWLVVIRLLYQWPYLQEHVGEIHCNDAQDLTSFNTISVTISRLANALQLMSLTERFLRGHVIVFLGHGTYKKHVRFNRVFTASC
jgi:hypothetical protein